MKKLAPAPPYCLRSADGPTQSSLVHTLGEIRKEQLRLIFGLRLGRSMAVSVGDSREILFTENGYYGLYSNK